LLGPSGSGKTSTLQLIAGFQTPTSGELDGVRITSVPPFRRGIGVVFQSYALFPRLDIDVHRIAEKSTPADDGRPDEARPLIFVT
jgi:ABC-type Fe3+/spermidine/putrescine transport system ATPase subunit